MIVSTSRNGVQGDCRQLIKCVRSDWWWYLLSFYWTPFLWTDSSLKLSCWDLPLAHYQEDSEGFAVRTTWSSGAQTQMEKMYKTHHYSGYQHQQWWWRKRTKHGSWPVLPIFSVHQSHLKWTYPTSGELTTTGIPVNSLYFQSVRHQECIQNSQEQHFPEAKAPGIPLQQRILHKKRQLSFWIFQIQADQPICHSERKGSRGKWQLLTQIS